MPVLREPVQTGRAVQHKPQEYQGGVAQPQMQQVDQERYGDGIPQALQGFKNVWDARWGELKQQAQAKGALDAQTSVDPKGEVDDRVDNTPMWAQEEYKKGFVTAASMQQLNKFLAETAVRAKEAAESGLSDEEYIKSERDAASTALSHLNDWLPYIDDGLKKQIADSMDNASVNALEVLNKTRSQLATTASLRTANENGYIAMQSMYASMGAGVGYERSVGVVKDHIQSVMDDPNLDYQTKSSYLSTYASLVAQNTDSPEVINQLANTFAKTIKDVPISNSIGSALNAIHDRTAAKYSLQTTFALRDQMNNILSLPAEERASAEKSFKDKLVYAYTSGRLSHGQALSMWDQYNASTAQSVTVGSYLADGGALNYDAFYRATGQSQEVFEKGLRNEVKFNPQFLAENFQRAMDEGGTLTRSIFTKGVEDTTSRIIKHSQTGTYGQIAEEDKAVIQAVHSYYTNGTPAQQKALRESDSAQVRALARSIDSAPSSKIDNVLDSVHAWTKEQEEAAPYVKPYNADLVKAARKELISLGDWASNYGASYEDKVEVAEAQLRWAYQDLKENHPSLLVGPYAAENLAKHAKENIGRSVADAEYGKGIEVMYSKDTESLIKSISPQINNSDAVQDAINTAVSSSAKLLYGTNTKDILYANVRPVTGGTGSDLLITYTTREGQIQNITIPNGVLDMAVANSSKSILNDEKAGSAAKYTVSHIDKNTGAFVYSVTDAVDMHGLGTKPISDLMQSVAADTGEDAKTVLEKVRDKVLPEAAAEFRESGFKDPKLLYSIAKVRTSLKPKDADLVVHYAKNMTGEGMSGTERLALYEKYQALVDELPADRAAKAKEFIKLVQLDNMYKGRGYGDINARRSAEYKYIFNN